MLFLIGFPQSIYSDLIKDVVRASPQELVSGLPNRENTYSTHYIEECFQSLLSYHEGRPRCFEKGLAIVAYSPVSDDSLESFSRWFYPFAIFRQISIGRRISTSRSQLSRDKNEIVRATLAAAKKAVKVRNQVTSYLTSRCKRTPFLLPIRHFGDQEIAEMIENAWGELSNADDATLVLDGLAKDFEKRYPFIKRRGATGYFVNAKSVEFHSPGRHLHGSTYPRVEGHQDKCFFNASLRVGGKITSGFHYDCLFKGGKHSGTFNGCHDEEINKKGNPHLNVYPNDFVR